MRKTKNLPTVVEEIPHSRILFLRGESVILAADLAEYFGVPTKALNQAVKRNIEKFPEEAMFQLTKQEMENLRSQNVTSSSSHGGNRVLPYAFTEIGCWSLPFILNSPKANKKGLELLKTLRKLRDYLKTQQIKSSAPITQALNGSTLNIYSDTVTVVQNYGGQNTLTLNINSQADLIKYLLETRQLLNKSDDSHLVPKLNELIDAVKSGNKSSIKDSISLINDSLDIITKISPAISALKMAIPEALRIFGL